MKQETLKSHDHVITILRKIEAWSSNPIEIEFTTDTITKNRQESDGRR